VHPIVKQFKVQICPSSKSNNKKKKKRRRSKKDFYC